MQKLSTKPYKGTRDFYPEEMRQRNFVFNKIRDLLSRRSYEQYDGPMLESFDTYAAKSGSELVEEQMYHFVDRGDRKVAIRPEMTPTLARMVAAKFGELEFPLKWFSFPNLWRYERPQRGRLREHWQVNADILGGDELAADLEILLSAVALLDGFGARGKARIRLNSRHLTSFYFNSYMGMNDEETKSLSRLIDAKEKLSVEVFSEKLGELGLSGDQLKKVDEYFSLNLKALEKFSDNEAISKFIDLLKGIEELGLANDVFFDPIIMRGLDYYTGMVFEAFDVSSENNRALFGGGRYDNLISLFRKEGISGVGFGLGDVGWFNFLETHQLLEKKESFCDVYVTLNEAQNITESFNLGEMLRNKGFKVFVELSSKSLKKSLKKAVKKNACFIVFCDENAENKEEELFVVKDLKKQTQEIVKKEKLLTFFEKQILEKNS